MSPCCPWKGTQFPESRTVWLSAERTSPYRFYQFWLNKEDTVVVQYLKYFTWFDREKISEFEEMVANDHEKREAQKTLAREVTVMVHGETALSKAEQASRVLFGGDITGLNSDDILDIFADVPSSHVQKSELEGGMKSVVDLLAESGFVKSKGEARRLISSGGMYFNNNRISDTESKINLNDAIEGKFIVFRKGKKDYHLVQIQ